MSTELSMKYNEEIVAHCCLTHSMQDIVFHAPSSFESYGGFITWQVEAYIHLSLYFITLYPFAFDL